MGLFSIILQSQIEEKGFEDVAADFIIFTFFAGFCGFVIFLFFRSLRLFNEGFLSKLSLGGLNSKSFSEQVQIVQYLGKHNTYFQKLSRKGKETFLNRLFEFLKYIDFVPRKGQTIQNQEKLLIGSAAIQLTYGLETYMFHHFMKIIVYPKLFEIGETRTKIKGGASEGGKMYLSWKYTLSGFLDPHDNLNLALHEFAHALEIDTIHHPDEDQAFAYRLKEWQKYIALDFQMIKALGSKYFRSYASANKKEFFAVLVENFFETPDLFNEDHPELFESICVLLNQDPRNSQNDYALGQLKHFRG